MFNVNNKNTKTTLLTIDLVLVSAGLLRVTVRYYNVTYAFQSKSTLYSCLSAKKLIAENRSKI